MAIFMLPLLAFCLGVPTELINVVLFVQLLCGDGSRS